MSLKVLSFSAIAFLSATMALAQAGSVGSGGVHRLGAYNGMGATSDKDLLDEDFTVRLERTMAFKEKYQYPQFSFSKVIVKGKHAASLKVNYHKLFGELLFINNKQDTLIINDNPAIEFIETPDALYYHHRKDGFFEMLSPQDYSTWLVVRRSVKIDKTERIAQNNSNALVSLDRVDTSNYHVVYHPRDPSKLRILVTFKEQNFFFLVDSDRDMSKASRKSFLRAFEKVKPELETYIKENNIDFDNEADLKKLYEYCTPK
jgi:hypothetical protein